MKALIVLFLSICLLGACVRTAQNVTTVSASDFRTAATAEDTAQILDVRSHEDYAESHVKGAVNVTWGDADFIPKAEQLDKSEPVYVYGADEKATRQAANALGKAGFTIVYELQGGLVAWDGEQLPMAREGANSNQVFVNLNKVVTKEQIDSAIVSAPQVIVDFYATWCAPCRKMEPMLSELQSEGNIVVYRVDAEVNKGIALSNQVQSIPVLMIYRDGKMLGRLEGMQTRNSVLEVYKRQ